MDSDDVKHVFIKYYHCPVIEKLIFHDEKVKSGKGCSGNSR